MSDSTALLKTFPAAAEYLTGLYLIQRDYGVAANQRLAQWLAVSTSAVTQALGRLKKIGLVDQKRYQSARLTPAGEKLALQVLRRHYLLEHLFVNTLGYPWDLADQEAKVLQNHISEAMTEFLDQKLGHPVTCPHGNPLPGTAGEEALLAAPRLSEAPQGQRVRLVRISEEGEGIPGLLGFCQKNHLHPQGVGVVLEHSANGTTLEMAGQSIGIPVEFAPHLRYQPA